MNRKEIIAVDIDGVLTLTSELNDYGRVSFEDLKKQYFEVKPNLKIIKAVNNLYKNYEIILYTSRNDYFREITKKWLKKYKVKYHNVVFNKLYYDYIIDDRAITI